MIIEDYGTALKKLTVMTQTKNLVLAHITGYDISYISKWCNGIKLPATKYIEKTNDQLSQYFAETIAKENKKIELCSMLSISADSDDITFEINQYLNAAYRSSMKKNTKRQKDFMSSVKVIAGNHDAAKFIHELFKEKLSHITVETELLILGEFCILRAYEKISVNKLPLEVIRSSMVQSNHRRTFYHGKTAERDSQG
jgi:hypothetical protein